MQHLSLTTYDQTILLQLQQTNFRRRLDHVVLIHQGCLGLPDILACHVAVLACVNCRCVR